MTPPVLWRCCSPSSPVALLGIYWGYKMGDKLDRARMRNNVPTGLLPILFLVLNIFGLAIVTCAIIQSELNDYTPVNPLRDSG